MFNKPTRNHITIIFEQLGAIGVIILTFFFSGLTDSIGSAGGIRGALFALKYGIKSQESIIFFVAAAVAVFMIGRLVFRWYKTFFYIDGEYLIYERRTLMKKTSRLPFSALATVNLERNIFERLVGTAKIKIDINSAVTADKTDFTFVLPLEKAKQLEKILVKAKDEASVQTETEVYDRQSVCSFTNAQAVRHVLLSQPVVQLLVSAVFIGSSVYSQFQMSDLSAVLPTVGLLLAAWIFGVIMKILSVCNFRIECDEKSIYISSGMLKVKKYSFERSKINAVVVRRPLLARMAGLYSAEVAVVGFGNDKEETPQISLLVKKQELEKILSLCVPDFSCTGEEKKAEKMGLLPCICSAVSVAVLLAVPLWFLNPVLSVIAAVICIVLGILSHKTKALRCDENIFSYSGGILSKKTALFKYRDIQTVRLHTNAVCKQFGIGRISLSILSSNAMRVHTTGWFKASLFEQLCERIQK